MNWFWPTIGGKRKGTGGGGVARGQDEVENNMNCFLMDSLQEKGSSRQLADSSPLCRVLIRASQQLVNMCYSVP